MSLFQWDQNPWGQDILVRISWDLLYLSILGGALFIIAHLVFRAKNKPEAAGASSPPDAPNVPEKIVRHPLASRLFHWTMAGSMLVLLGTGFLPILGVQFDWVSIHWTAGLVLIATIVFHIIHSIFWMNLRDIWISGKDWAEWKEEVRHALGKGGAPEKKAGKYPVDHRIFHNMIALAAFAVMITGVLMMVRVENSLFARNPYLLADSTWGWVYVIHGLSAVAFVGMTMTHIYFAILPEKRWMTLSMIFGWIKKEDYLAHHDPNRWVVSKDSSD